MADAPMIMAFVSGFLGILGVNFLFADIAEHRRRELRKRLDREIALEQRERARLALARTDAAPEKEGAESALLDIKPTFRERLAWFIDQSGIKVTLSQVCILSLLFGGMVLVVLGILFSHWLPALVLAPLAAIVPWGYIAMKKSWRLERLRLQLPDVFDMMSRVLRSGQTISQALQAVADEFPRPASEEFGYCYEQQNLGLSPAVALRELARRTGLLELKIFVMSVGVHRQTGGNLAELLDKLASIIRDRTRIRGMIQSLTAEGRFQAIVLLALPPFLLAAITLVNRPYAAVLYQYSTLLAGMSITMTAGAVWMYKIIHFDF